jgi:hypothetical protein
VIEHFCQIVVISSWLELSLELVVTWGAELTRNAGGRNEAPASLLLLATWKMKELF